MSAETHKPENAANGGYERQDLQTAAIVYFLLGLVVITILIVFALNGLYRYLDAREKASPSAVSPLATNVPSDTRNIPRDYPQSTFPNPKLEEDERGQLNGIRLTEEQTLNSYGWVDQTAGTVRVPIERAMDLLAQRGLPVRPQGTGTEVTAAPTATSRKAKQK